MQVTYISGKALSKFVDIFMGKFLVTYTHKRTHTHTHTHTHTQRCAYAHPYHTHTGQNVSIQGFQINVENRSHNMSVVPKIGHIKLQM
jgi:hypothetical protein